MQVTAKGWIWGVLLLAASLLTTVKAQTPCFSLLSDSILCQSDSVKLLSCATGISDPGAVVYYVFRSGTDSCNNGNIITYKQGITPTPFPLPPGVYSIGQVTGGQTGQICRLPSFFRRVYVLDSIRPEFDYISCSGRRVELRFRNVKPGERFRINWGDGSLIQTTPFTLATSFSVNYVYSRGTLATTIRVTGDKRCTRVVNQLVNIVQEDAGLTSLNVRTNRNGSLELEVRGLSNLAYRLHRVTPTGTIPVTLSNTGTNTFVTPSTAHTPSTPTLMALAVRDQCAVLLDSVVFPTQPMSGRVIPPIELSWPTAFASVGVLQATRQQMLRNGGSIFTFPSIPSNTFRDSNAICGQVFCYRLQNEYSQQRQGLPALPVTVVSDSLCFRAIDRRLPQPPQNPLGTVVNGQAQISWSNAIPSGVTMTILKSGNGGSSQQVITSPTSPRYLDPVPLDGSYCYSIRYTDNCGNTSAPNQVVCPIFLTVNNTSLPRLDWNFYVPGRDTLHYFVEYLNESGQVISRRYVNGSNNFQEPQQVTGGQTIRYRIMAYPRTADSLSRITYSNIVTVEQSDRLRMPTAFSPNGDNLNDVFMVYGDFVRSLDLRIYNRWGEIVFRSTDLNTGWDGTYVGGMCPTGVYNVVLNAETESGQRIVQRGAITLLR